MLQIRAYVPPDHLDAIVSTLDTVDGIGHVMRVGTTERGAVLVTADVSADAADVAFEKN